MENPPPRLLLELPILVLEKILEKLTPRDLIAFSFSSIDASRIVKAIRPRINEIHILFELDRVAIILMKIERGVSKYRGGLVIYKKDLPFNDKSLIYSPNYELGIADDDAAEFLLVSHCPQQQMEAVKLSLQHICAIYRRNKFFRMFEVKMCLKVEQSEEQSEENPTNINDNINLSLHFSKLRNLALLDLHSAPWFANQHLLSMNNRVIYVRNTKITSVGVNKWLKAWMTRDDNRMVSINIQAQKSFDAAVVLRDIPFFNWDEDAQMQHLVTSTFHSVCIQGELCITRRDGSVAHVDILGPEVQIYIR